MQRGKSGCNAVQFAKINSKIGGIIFKERRNSNKLSKN